MPDLDQDQLAELLMLRAFLKVMGPVLAAFEDGTLRPQVMMTPGNRALLDQMHVPVARHFFQSKLRDAIVRFRMIELYNTPIEKLEEEIVDGKGRYSGESWPVLVSKWGAERHYWEERARQYGSAEKPTDGPDGHPDPGSQAPAEDA